MARPRTHRITMDTSLYEPSLLNAMNSFVEQVGLRHSAGTACKRRSCLLRFIHYLHTAGIMRYQDVTTDDLWRFHGQLKQQDYSTHSLYAYLTSVRLFYRYLTGQSMVFENPAAAMILAKPKQRLGLVLTEEEIRKLLRQPDIATPLGLRDRAMLEVLYSTGIRLGECSTLTVFDADPDNATLTVIGKGSKERILPLGRHAVRYLRRYLKDARPKLIRDNDPPEALWLSHRKARPLDKGTIRITVQKYARRADLPAETDTHTLRRTCATHMLRGGAHPMAVATLLGHSGLASLAHYLKTTITDLTNTHKETKPGT